MDHLDFENLNNNEQFVVQLLLCSTSAMECEVNEDGLPWRAPFIDSMMQTIALQREFCDATKEGPKEAFRMADSYLGSDIHEKVTGAIKKVVDRCRDEDVLKRNKKGSWD